MPFSLQTSRLHIREFKDSDLANLSIMMKDPLVMQTTGFRKVQTNKEIQRLLKKWIQETILPFGSWCVAKKQSDEMIGWAMLKPTYCEDPEIGYMVLQNHWGKGFATEIGMRLLDYATTETKATKVVARTDPENQASIHVLQKIGLSKIRNNRIKTDVPTCYFEKNFSR